MRSHALVALATSAAISACASSRPFVITQTYENRNSLTLPAPAGPIAVSGPLREGEVVLEGGATVNPVSNAPGARTTGASGNQYTLANGGIRAMGRVSTTPLELGGAVDFASTATSRPGYGDQQPDENGAHGGFGRMSLLARLSVGGPRVGVGFNLEGGLIVGDLRSRTTVTITRRYTDTGETSSVMGTGNWTRTVPTGDFRAGAFVYGRPIPRLTLSLGGLLQVVPAVEGYSRRDTTCSGVGIAGEIGCYFALALDAALSHLETPRIGTAAMFTTWAAVGVDVGPVTLYAQGFVHPIGQQSLEFAVRGGAQLGVQLVFDTRNPHTLRGAGPAQPDPSSAPTAPQARAPHWLGALPTF